MSQVETTYRSEKSRDYPHIEWLELHSDGVMHECAIMRRDGSGNILYFRVNDLDDFDKRRLVSILSDRNARNFPLWDLMANRTLNNGVNALKYFHQLVKQLTPNGKIIDPRSGQMGMTGRVDTNKQE
jgi:hypothetical protein